VCFSNKKKRALIAAGRSKTDWKLFFFSALQQEREREEQGRRKKIVKTKRSLT
jgi:hypothetical protein